jgi:hypothetical protein
MASRSSSRPDRRTRWLAAAAGGLFALAGCHTAPRADETAPRTGDEIIVAGQAFHTGTRVVTWQEPGGYNAYQGAPPLRPRPGGGSPAALRKNVDQFVLHYDACGLSKVCFNVLHARGLSVHFMLDVDGTVYQTLDLQERALHATTSNDRSIGIEIANIGAYPPTAAEPFALWYRRDAAGGTVLTVPARIRDPGIRTPGFTGRPARPAPVRGVVQGTPLVQYDFTPEQYAALTRLTAALCRIFPRIKDDYPHDAAGRLITQKLPDPVLANYRGLLGHYHIQENKDDPGPAFQWKLLLDGVRALGR